MSLVKEDKVLSRCGWTEVSIMADSYLNGRDLLYMSHSQKWSLNFMIYKYGLNFNCKSYFLTHILLTCCLHVRHINLLSDSCHDRKLSRPSLIEPNSQIRCSIFNLEPLGGWWGVIQSFCLEILHLGSYGLKKMY